MATIILCIIACTLLLESLFCYVMKRHKLNGNGNTDKIEHYRDFEKNKKSSFENNRLGFVRFAISVFGDFTFFLFKLCGYIPSHFIRLIMYKYIFHMIIGDKVVIYYGLEARHPWNITIGKGTIIGDHCLLDARNGISIGENVNLSTGVWIWTLQHSVDSSSFGTEGNGGMVVIQDRAWISSRTNILPMCTVAEGSVIACGAVLTKSTEPYGIYGGIPAKRVKERNKNLDYVFNGKHRLFL